MGSLALIILLSYFVGSIPTSIIVSKIARGIDIRNYGSGNAGGTNVMRIFGWKVGVLVMIIDGLKGYVATVFISRLYFDTSLPFNNRTPFDDFTLVQIIAGIAAIFGHVWTIFAGFRGGKGISTAGGMMVGLAPVEIAVALAVFGIVLAISRYISLSSLSAVAAVPMTMFVRYNIFRVDIQGYHTLIYFTIGVVALLFYTHRKNIKRLLEGTENKITEFKLRRARGKNPSPSL